MENNPTCHLKRSQLWGFEITHLLASFVLMMVSNLLFSALGLPLMISWILGLVALVCLRLLSLGKKLGHMGFLLSYLTRPRLYLGCLLRGQKGRV